MSVTVANSILQKKRTPDATSATVALVHVPTETAANAPADLMQRSVSFEHISSCIGSCPSSMTYGKRFLMRPRSSLARLFEVYDKPGGTVPAQYDRATFSSWRCGEWRMSGQTAERLLNLFRVSDHLSAV
jgi:hypothetical protein